MTEREPDRAEWYMNLIEFRLTPPGGMRLRAPAGHYLSIALEPIDGASGAEAQIIAVGCFRGPDGYVDAIPGWVVISVEEMLCGDGDRRGQRSGIHSILLRRSKPGEGYGSKSYICV